MKKEQTEEPQGHDAPGTDPEITPSDQPPRQRLTVAEAVARTKIRYAKTLVLCSLETGPFETGVFRLAFPGWDRS